MSYTICYIDPMQYCITCFFLIIVKSYKPIVNAYSIQKTLTPIIDKFKKFPARLCTVSNSLWLYNPNSITAIYTRIVISPITRVV